MLVTRAIPVEPPPPASVAIGGARRSTEQPCPPATGPIEDDPNLTVMRFPGKPAKSYRS